MIDGEKPKAERPSPDSEQALRWWQNDPTSMGFYLYEVWSYIERLEAEQKDLIDTNSRQAERIYHLDRDLTKAQTALSQIEGVLQENK